MNNQLDPNGNPGSPMAVGDVAEERATMTSSDGPDKSTTSTNGTPTGGVDVIQEMANGRITSKIGASSQSSSDGPTPQHAFMEEIPENDEIPREQDNLDLDDDMSGGCTLIPAKNYGLNFAAVYAGQTVQVRFRVEQVNPEEKLCALQKDLEKLMKDRDEINRLLNEEKRISNQLENENKDLQLQNHLKSKDIEALELEKSAIEKRLQTALVTIKNLEQKLEHHLIDYSSRSNIHRVEEPGKPRINVDVRGNVLSCGFHFGRLMPLWVQEYIGKDEENFNQDKTSTKQKFKRDSTWHNNCLTDDDYKDLNERMFNIHNIKNMYDKGHMARKGNYKSSTHREETCCNFNICPQHRGLNQGAWLKLERLVLEWAKECDHGLWICCGPLWIGDCTITIGKGANVVPVPSHYYKVVLLAKGNTKEIRAFRFPNEKVKLSEPDGLKAYIVSVEKVEHDLGCEIFPEVDRDTLLVSDWQPTPHQT